MITPQNKEDDACLASATHPVLSYYTCKGRTGGDWTIAFHHPILQAFRSKSTSSFEETLYGNSLQLYVKDANGKRLSCGTALDPDVGRLLERSTPSSFGLGDDNVYDEDVRKGRELTKKQLSKMSLSAESRQEIHQSLFPHSKKIRCRFSKMAIYETGGHFDVHRDTVRSHAHQGTLLVEVQSTHSGGDLILEPTSGEVVRWSLSSTPSDLPSNMVRYIAFYTDVTHRVEPVQSGVRIVLQYDIYVDDIGVDDWEEEEYDFFGYASTPKPISNESTTLLLTLLGEYVTDQMSVSFPLLHLYTDTKLLPSRLKVGDQEIFNALLNHGYHVQMVPVEITSTSNWEGTWTMENDHPKYEIRSLSTVWCDGYTRGEDGEITESKLIQENVLYVATGFEQLVEMDSTSFIEYTGNESSPAEYRYFQSVFVVSINRVQKREKKAKKGKKGKRGRE
jgi:hypothetical protein